MLLKSQCELMLLNFQINTNAKKKGFLHPTKCLERVLKYSYLVSIIFKNYQFPKTMFAIFFVLTLDFNSISSHFNSISSRAGEPANFFSAPAPAPVFFSSGSGS